MWEALRGQLEIAKNDKVAIYSQNGYYLSYNMGTKIILSFIMLKV